MDNAIAAYEASLAVIPSGTWKIPNSQFSYSLLPPRGGVQARLDEANKRKQQWLSEEKPEIEQPLIAARSQLQALVSAQQNATVAQQAEAARQAQERAARTVTEDMFQVRQNPDNTVTITRYTGDVENVVIPSTLYGLRVTHIGDSSFIGNTAIHSVVIPDTVVEIGNQAFRNDTDHGQSKGKLSRVTLGRGVRTIGALAFCGNPITEITFPDSVTSIGDNAFSVCNLTSITWGRGLQEIGFAAFYSNKLTSVTLPAGLKRINGSFSFNPITSVSIPPGIEVVSGTVFSNTHQYEWSSLHELTRATIPANLSNDVMRSYGFEESLRNFYASQNRAAGTYVKNGPIWSRQ